MLEHRREQLVQVGELLGGFLHLRLLVLYLSLDALVLLVSLFLLSHDLNGKNEEIK